MNAVMDAFRLDGKVAVVTGGAGLLGRQHAEALLEAGAMVALLDVNADRLATARQGLAAYGDDRLLARTCDIVSPSSVADAKRAVETCFGQHATILINNAAIDPKFDKSVDGRPPSRLENFSIEQWNMEISVGLTGALVCTQAFGYEMALKGGGVILNVASDLGVIAPDQRLYRQEGLPDDLQNVKPATYSVIKHGLIGFTKYVATYWASRGVRCNAFAPGGVFNDHPDAFVAKLSQLIPMGRMARKDEYKAAIVFLTSDASSYMNGATLNFDGGRTAW